MAPHLWKHSTKMKKPPSMKMPQCDSPEEKPISTQLYVTKKGHIAQMNQCTNYTTSSESYCVVGNLKLHYVISIFLIHQCAVVKLCQMNDDEINKILLKLTHW